MKNLLKTFLTAVMFYTRIPCPKWVDHSEDQLNKSTVFLPVIGWIVGLLTGLSCYLAVFILPSQIAIIISMISGLLITGAFHEDGLADACDGFGGGWTKEKILSIMKDSRLGVFGAIGLIVVLLFKFILLNEIIAKTSISTFVLVSVSAHSISRSMAAGVVFFYNYVREDSASKVRPIAKRLSSASLIILLVFGIIPLSLYNSYYVLITVIPVTLTGILLMNYFKKWIGGYTGDCLGAIQQITEIIFYLCIIILWKFI